MAQVFEFICGGKPGMDYPTVSAVAADDLANPLETTETQLSILCGRVCSLATAQYKCFMISVNLQPHLEVADGLAPVRCQGISNHQLLCVQQVCPNLKVEFTDAWMYAISAP